MTDFTKGIIVGMTVVNIGWIVANILFRIMGSYCT